ncbi:terminase small subunit [Virgibacillus pantothenticus]|uniref:Terminase n=1 Tax=Virgibacillus pantothenticus TaxID=1473 RepID=A0A0L0QW90_VIRPA|nr:terminase small subunit [Virgibacillus pantothenticus]KNE22468.1 terminase [Virgibacillus pantothenticus]MED3738086.1 terminase small subunit [Virgibacillus pantothenticus]QTY16935.1 terminase small subunit [Virgibacillus pantothenticus]
MRKKMTPRQQKFADEYIITGNATESAVKAGYSKKYANTNANKLLQNTTIRKYIDERLEELKSQAIADQQEVLEYLTAVLRGKAKGTELVGTGGGEQEVKMISPSIEAKTKAAELLGKRYALWTEKQQIEDITPVFIEDVPEND